MSSPPPIHVEPKKKSGCLKAFLIVLGAGFVLSILLVVLLVVFGNRETKAHAAIADPFLSKIQSGEFQEAYAMASPEYRESVEYSDFESLVRELNLEGYSKVDWRYHTAENLDEEALKGFVTCQDGSENLITLTLKEGEGGLAVSGLSKLKEKPKAAKKSGSKTTVTTWAKKESKTKSGSWSWSTARLENIRFETAAKVDSDPPVFSADSSEIKLVADLKSAPPKTKVTAVFLLAESADGEVKDLEVVRTSIVGDSEGKLVFSFSRTDPVSAIGRWVVKLYIDSNLKAEKAFLVEFDLPSLIAKAEAGDAEAQLGVGLAYRQAIIGYTGPLNETESVKWLEKSAQQGDQRAQYYLSEMYMLGRGVSTDEPTAISWLEKSAGQGFAEAQRVIGEMYREGEGVERDLDRAASWLEKASNQGDVAATTRLGELLLNYGADDQKAKGAELIRSAAATGYPDAQFVMGQIHERGVVVEVDPAKAREYFEAAAANGSPGAVEALQRLDAKPEE